MSRSEHDEQKIIFNSPRLRKYKEYELLFAIPNAQVALMFSKSKRERFAAVNYMSSEGRKKGVPDMFLPVARGGYHGLFIELKAEGKFHNTSEEQDWWLDELEKQGYLTDVCEGSKTAIYVIEEYLNNNFIKDTNA